MPAISVTIITLNEAAHLAEAIASVAWADEIVVVDSGSTDGTIDIARRLATRVECREWPGYAAQKNYAASIARHDWVLSLDADERVSGAPGALAGRLAHGHAGGPRLPPAACLVVPRSLDPDDRLVPGSPAPALRPAGRPVDAIAGARVGHARRRDDDARAATWSCSTTRTPTSANTLRRIDAYTSLAALDMRDRGASVGALGLAVHPVAAFLRNYLLRRGMLDGRAGLAVSLLNSYYVLLKHVKLLELQQTRG